MMRRYGIGLAVLLILLSEITSAQSFYAIRRERNLLATIGTGSANYYGELVNPGEFGKIRYNLLVGAEYYLNSRISVRSELVYFRISGSDKLANDNRTERNLSFFSGNLELNATGVINLFPNQARFYQRPQINFFAFAGIGLLYTNPKTERANGEKVALQPLQTEGVHYSKFQPVIPMGLGARYKVGPFINIIVEGGYRLTFTDYLDDISSSKYADPATLSSPLAVELSDRRRELDPDYPLPPGVGIRGNPKNNDGYFLMNIKIQYYLPQVIFAGGQRKLYNQKRKSYYRR